MSNRIMIALIMIFLSLDVDIILFETAIRIPLTSVFFKYFLLMYRVADITHGILSIAGVFIIISELKKYFKNRSKEKSD